MDMTWVDILREQIERRGMLQEAVAKKAMMSSPHLSNMLRGKGGSEDKVMKVADVLEMDQDAKIDLLVAFHAAKTKFGPIWKTIRSRVASPKGARHGEGRITTGKACMLKVFDFIQAPRKPSKGLAGPGAVKIAISQEQASQGAFAVLMDGRHMEPRISHGDICLFLPVAEIDRPDPSKVYLVEVPGRDRMEVWQVQSSPSGGVLLAPLNPSFKAVEVGVGDGADLRIAGVMVEMRRMKE